MTCGNITNKDVTVFLSGECQEVQAGMLSALFVCLLLWRTVRRRPGASLRIELFFLLIGEFDSFCVTHGQTDQSVQPISRAAAKNVMVSPSPEHHLKAGDFFPSFQ